MSTLQEFAAWYLPAQSDDTIVELMEMECRIMTGRGPECCNLLWLEMLDAEILRRVQLMA